VRPAHPAVVNGGVHTAGFYVLVGARMPGVLFEASYLSHPEEGELLSQGDYQSRLADGIVNAIRAYRAGR
jgi:N-acetylmuramoyl-L-alanine amidase